MTRAAVRGTGFQMSPSDTTFRIGVDENGLGSRLGPMIVTAVLARVTPEGSARAKTKARGALSSRLDDSKALVAHGDVALGEAWARAVVARDTTRSAPTTPDELVHALALDDRNALREPCPSHVAARQGGIFSLRYTRRRFVSASRSNDGDRLFTFAAVARRR
jgi:hypothetical protein